MRAIAVSTRASEDLGVPQDVKTGGYQCSPPLIRKSRLTATENGGVGKNLSEGWNLNFAVGCVHACPFCYVDSIHKRFGSGRYGELVLQKWGNYMLVPDNLQEAIERTNWSRWEGKEVMMSSTHDPYLPQLAGWARLILEKALVAGVRVCLQTRSYLVAKDLKFLSRFSGQVRLQVSIATMNRDLALKIEPRVPSPTRRLEVLSKAKANGLKTGVIIAPVFPSLRIRSDFKEDLKDIATHLGRIEPDLIYGESFHIRGENLRLVESALGERVSLSSEFDQEAEKAFSDALSSADLIGEWWPR